MQASATIEEDEGVKRIDAALRALVCLLARQAAQETIAKSTASSAEEDEPGKHAGPTNG